MEELLFGTAGVPHSAESRTTIDGIKRIAALGLGCMEIEFVRGVMMGEEGARQVAEVARETGVKLSAHAPYYINMNSHEPAKLKASQQRLLLAARVAGICGARSVIFHPAFYMGDPSEAAFATVKKAIEEVRDKLKEEGNKIRIRPELMGKPSQFGDLEETLRLCAEVEGLSPCIDFAHWHARTSAYNTYDEFAHVLTRIREVLGQDALEDLHIHFSGIQYGAKGERKHLDLDESDLNYKELLKALRDFKVRGLVVCESPNLEGDALMLHKTYHSLAEAE